MERQPGGVLFVGGKAAVCHHLADSVPVADHKSVEMQLMAQHLGHQPPVGGEGNAVDIIEPRHDRGDAFPDSAAESGQIGVLQQIVSDLRMVVVPAALGGAVAHKMLGQTAMACSSDRSSV